MFPPCLHSATILSTKDVVYQRHNFSTLQRIRLHCFFAAACVLIFLAAGAPGWATTIARNPNNTALSQAHSDPQALVRSVVQKELADTYGTRQPLRYRLHKVTVHLNTTKEIVETKDGDVACLVASGGQPLTPQAWQSERARLQQLQTQPALEQHRRSREQADTQRVEKVLRALPDAFQYKFAGVLSRPGGTVIRLTFEPNPNFSPQDYETHVLKGMRGEIWIDAAQKRMLRFDAHLFEGVDFGWGILGYLNKGGSVLIEQGEVVPSMWALTHMHLSLTGRALLVKPLKVEMEETATDYQRVAGDLSYQQAVDVLLREQCGSPTAAPEAGTANQQ